MSLLPILTLPDTRLRLVSDPVGAVGDDVRTLLDDMLETMDAAPGIGLAAIQIGVPRRIVVVDVAKRKGEEEEEVKDPIFLVNPEIVRVSPETSVYEEGCLSIPDYYAEVERPARVRVRYLDRAGAMQELDADGILATCIQHEIDHLRGKVFVEYLSRLKQTRIRHKLTKQQRENM